MFDPFSIIAGIGTSVAGAGIGGLMGGSQPTYKAPPIVEDLTTYGEDQIRASKSQKKAIKAEAKALRKSGNRGAAEAHLQSYRDRFVNPEFIDKALAKSYKKPINYASDPFQAAAQEVYGQQGLGYSVGDFENFMKRAQGKGIRSAQAFSDMLKQDLIASGKVMTPDQQQLALIYGTPTRTPDGVYTNTYKPLAEVEPYDISKLPFLPASFGA